MSSITFDKLAYVETLKASGVDGAQAKAQAEALDVALRETVATKADLHTEVDPLRSDIAVLKAELAMVKWLVSVIGFGVLLLVLKSFWPVG